MKRLLIFLRSDWAFYIPLSFFILAAIWVAISSVYPMAFDEEFHLGLIKIYATSWLPYGIVHTADMAQYGAATADPSYLFHYLMSFPYRLFDMLGLSDVAIIVLLRLMNLGFIVAGLFVFRKVFLAAGISKPVVTIGLWFMTLIPVFVMLAGQINYDNLLFLIVAWSIYLLVDMTNRVKASGEIPIRSAWLLAIAILIGISIKYAFLPIALVLLAWSIGLVVIIFRRHKASIRTCALSVKKQFLSLSRRTLIGLIVLTFLSVFFASHYIVNNSKYGHAIPSCEQVFTEDECTAYGPWNRNRGYIAQRGASFVPLSYPVYMAVDWLPGMAQRLTFSVAGKSNDFQTKLPLPVVVYTFVVLTALGVICFIIQAAKRKVSWFGWLTALLVSVYTGILSLQLYGDYVDTAQPVAINGRYLILLLPLVSVVLVQAISAVFKNIPASLKAAGAIGMIAILLVAGAGVSTYILQSEQSWFWPGFGQASHGFLKTLLSAVILPFRF